MKKYFILIILLFINNELCLANSRYVNYWNRNQECVGFDFENKNITEINITNEEKYIIGDEKKYYITDNLDSCLGIKIKSDNAIKLLPNNCHFLFGDACIDLSTGNYELFQFECKKDGCIKLDVFTEYNEPDIE